MKTRSLPSVIPALLAIALLLQNPTPAGAVTLDALVAGAVIQCGDKLFTGFDYTTTGPDMPAAAVVGVNCIQLGRNHGLQFTSLWVDNSDDGGFQDALIAYAVQTLGADIIDAELVANPVLLPRVPGQQGDDGFVTVSESLLIVPAGAIPTLEAFAAFDDVNSVFITVPGDRETFARRQEVQVATRITLSNDGHQPQVSIIDQTFSQVPEPSTMFLFGLGLMLVWGLHLRRPLPYLLRHREWGIFNKPRD